jgi:hypothetical protein
MINDIQFTSQFIIDLPVVGSQGVPLSIEAQTVFYEIKLYLEEIYIF